MPSLKTLALLFSASVSTIATALPTTQHYHTTIRRQDVQDEYDYVIVGGGTAGLTVGDRLTENGKYSVLVIEYGIFHEQTGMNPTRMFNITSQPSPELNNRSFSVGIGCCVGGSSCVNGQVMLRGTKDEYDAWEELGGPGSEQWNWENLLPYFKKAHQLSPPPAEVAEEFDVRTDLQYWGNETPIWGAFGDESPPNITKVLHSAMAAMPGMTIADDSGAGQNGLYWYSLSQDPVDYKRSYARTGHWDNVQRDNYEMITSSKVKKVLLDDDLNAVGVEFVSLGDADAKPVQVSAKREVILAAGTIHTPQVLMLSGIGPATHLEEAGIDVKVDLPGVGSNFQDHSYVPNIQYRWGKTPEGGSGSGSGPGFGPRPNLVAMVGLPVLSPDSFESLASLYEDQDPSQHLPSFYTDEQIEGYRAQQAVYARLMRSPNTTFNEMMMYGPGGSVQNLHAMSRGTVLLNTSNPEGEVLVDYRAATNEIDLLVMAENVRFMRHYMLEGELAQYEAVEVSPGLNVESTEELVEWARRSVIPSVYHPVGTAAKMPPELGGVVDEQLMVHGVGRLSVVDGSIMPVTVGATTQQTVYAVAEKVSDLIKVRTFDKDNE